MDDSEQLKVVFVGASGVGKTALMIRFAQNQFKADDTATVGASFIHHTHLVEGKKRLFELWDTAGQERYARLVPVYFRNA